MTKATDLKAIREALKKAEDDYRASSAALYSLTFLPDRGGMTPTEINIKHEWLQHSAKSVCEALAAVSRLEAQQAQDNGND